MAPEPAAEFFRLMVEKTAKSQQFNREHRKTESEIEVEDSYILIPNEFIEIFGRFGVK